MEDLKITVRGQEYPVTVRVNHDGKGAWFSCDPGNGVREQTSQTWEGLYKNMMTATKRPAITVAIPVMEYLPRLGRFRKGVATGIHQGTGKVLVTWERRSGHGEDKEQVNGYQGYFEPLSEEDQKEYHRLWTAHKQAGNVLTEFESSRKLALHSEVRDAVEAELKRQVEAEL